MLIIIELKQNLFLLFLASSKQDIGGVSTPMATPKQIKTPSETFINNEDTV